MKQQHVHPTPLVAGPRGFGAPDDPASLWPYVQAIWRARILIGVLALVGGGAAFAIASLAKPQFEASVTLVVTESKVSEQAGPAAPVANFESLLKNQAIAVQVIQKFGLDKPPYFLGPSTFLVRVATVERITGTSLLQLRIRLDDPTLAAQIANFMAERALELVQRMNETEAVRARNAIAEQLNESRQRMNDVETKLEALRKQGQVDLLKSDVETLLLQRQTLADVTVRIASERAWLEKAQEELGQRTRIDVLTRSVDNDPTLREIAKRAGGADTLALQMKDEQLNPTYDDLDSQIARTRASVSGLERQRAALLADGKLDAGRLPRLTELYTREAEISRMEVDRDLARRVYIDIATRYEQARTQVATRSALLQVVDLALTPQRSLPRNRGRNVIFGVLGGFFAGFALVLGTQIIRQAASMPHR